VAAEWSGPITAHVFVSREMTDDQPQTKPGLVLAEKRRVAFFPAQQVFHPTNSRSAPHKCPRSSPNGQLAAHAPEKDRLASSDLQSSFPAFIHTLSLNSPYPCPAPYLVCMWRKFSSCLGRSTGYGMQPPWL
jgi:hypothetical protein